MRKVKKKKKYQQLTHFFNKKLYIHNDLAIEKWMNC